MFDLHQIKAASLEEALRQMPAAAVIVEAPSGKLILINERARQLLEQNAGWSGLLEPGEVGDFGDLRMFHPDGRPVEMEEWPLVRSMRSGEEVRDEEHSYLLADGSRLTLRSDASPIHDDEGRIVAGVLIVRDITERKQAAEEQERLAKIVQNSSDFIGICDLDWQVSYVNEAGQRLVGLGGLEEARRTRVPDYFAPEDRAFVADEMFAAVMEEGRWTGELKLRHFETGEQIPVSWDVFRIDDPTTGDPFSITTIARDISSRKRDEEALRGSKRRTENIPESITEDFITVDREWRLTYASERALGTMRKTKGEELTREEFLGNNIWELYPELVGSTLYQKYHEALREHKTVQFEAYFSTSDTWYEVHAYPSEEGLSIYSQDITERKRAEEQLAYHASLLENIHDAVLATDERYVVTAWNKGAEEMYGWRSEEALGRDVREVARSEVTEEQWAENARELDEAGRFRTELIAYRRDGTPVHIELIVVALRGEQGEVTGYLGIHRDVTERKLSEAELRQGEERFRATFEQAAVGMSHTAPDGTLLRVNRKLCEILGYTPEEMLGMKIQSRTHPDDLDKDVEQAGRLIAGEIETYSMEKRLFRKDGSIVWINLTASLVRDSAGEPNYFIAVCEDIDERKRYEAEKQRLVDIVQNSSDFIGIHDLDWRATFVNEAGQRLVGLHGIEEVRQKAVLEFFVPGDRAFVRDEVFPTIMEQGRWVGELNYRNFRTNESIPVVWDAFRIDDPRTGEPISVATVTRDITERKRAEEALKESERQRRFVLGAVGLGSWRLDPATRHLESSEACKRNFGLPPDADLPFERFLSMLHPDDRGSVLGAIEESIATSTGYEADYRVVAPGGEVRWVAARGRMVHTPDGEPPNLAGVTLDITKRKRDEERLRESSRRTEDILESVTDAFYALDREWRLTYLNERALRFASQLAGEEFTLDDLIGRTLWETLPAIVGTSIEDEYRRAVREQKTAIFEYPYPGGGPIFEVHAYPSEQGLSIYFQDITERKKAEQATRAHARQQEAVAELGLQALADHGLQSLMDETVARVARTLELEYCKIVDPLHGSESGSGAGDEELFFLWAGVGWREGLVGSTENADLDPQSAYTLRSGEPVIVEDLSTEARFAPAPILIEHGVVSTMSVVIPGRERPFGVLGAYTESHRIFSEDDVNFLQAVANVLAAAVERDEAEEKLHRVREAERSRIARDLHDEALRDLTYALMEAQYVQSTLNELTPVHRLGRLIVALKRTGLRLRAAIYDLRLGREQGQPFSELLESLVELHRTMAPRCDIRLDVGDGVLSSPLGQSGTELLRVVGEALTNARRHSEARNVWVSVWASEEKLWAEVSDDGRGFDPDEETSASRKATGGTGIKGMRERARAQDGDLEIESQPGGGTKVRFELTMKKARAELETQEPEEGEPEEGEPEEEPRQKVRILLVEDHAAVREAIASSFEREAGFEVVGQAASLAQARRMIGAEPGEEPENLSEPVDVAVIDLGLPDGYGGELIGELRESNPEAQALVLSANLDRAELARAVESGAAGVLHKTVHLDEVVDAVRRLRAGETLMPVEEVVELLRFAGSRREEEYEARRTIARLTPREIEVLQALSDGLNSEGVAGRLNISLRTERNHVSSILAKLGVHSQLQALVFALRHGAVELR